MFDTVLRGGIVVFGAQKRLLEGQDLLGECAAGAFGEHAVLARVCGRWLLKGVRCGTVGFK